MIVKPYTPRRVTDVRLKAGVAAEKQMAHYLDRHFRDSKRFYVLHDVRFEHLGDNAQVDHLVIHPFGIAIVESKSVASAVRINARDEWERRQGRGWVGMANPLLQAERQGKLLKSLLKSREPDLLDKVLGLAQGTFSMMAVDTYAAISDKGRIERYDISQAPKALKADAVPSAIEDAVAGGALAEEPIPSRRGRAGRTPRQLRRRSCRVRRRTTPPAPGGGAWEDRRDRRCPAR